MPRSAAAAPPKTANLSIPTDMTLADALNDPDADPRRDLRIVEELLDDWLVSNPPGRRPPLGSNEEITHALTAVDLGAPPVLPPHHPAIDASGQLCDRWGTPYFLHPLSENSISVRSAGPDRRMFTADDLELAPRSD